MSDGFPPTGLSLSAVRLVSATGCKIADQELLAPVQCHCANTCTDVRQNAESGAATTFTITTPRASFWAAVAPIIEDRACWSCWAPNGTYTCGLVPLSREIDSWQALTMPGIERTDRKSSSAIGADPRCGVFLVGSWESHCCPAPA
jgi:hypothetical protein